MIRHLAVVLAAAMLSPLALAQNGASNPQPVLHAQLTHGLQARRAKPGDPVLAKCTEEFHGPHLMVIPKNAKIIGHVTRAKRKGSGRESLLGISFDRAMMRDGRQVPLNAFIQALAPPRVPPDSERGRGDPGGNSLEPAVLARAREAEGLPWRLHDRTKESADTTLTKNSKGVFGLKGVELTSSAKESVIHSSSGSVRLESGTQMLLRLRSQ